MIPDVVHVHREPIKALPSEVLLKWCHGRGEAGKWILALCCIFMHPPFKLELLIKTGSLVSCFG